MDPILAPLDGRVDDQLIGTTKAGRYRESAQALELRLTEHRLARLNAA